MQTVYSRTAQRTSTSAVTASTEDTGKLVLRAALAIPLCQASCRLEFKT